MVMRCYNGAWDSEASAMFSEQDVLMTELRKVEPEAHCTHFPSEGQFQVHVWGRPLSELSDSKIAALRQAIERTMS